MTNHHGKVHDDGNEEGIAASTSTEFAVEDRKSRLFQADVSRRSLLGAVGISAIGGSLASPVMADRNGTEQEDSATGVAIIVLDLEPLARHDGNREDHADDLAEQREEYKEWMAEEAPRASVIYEYDYVLNGLAVRRNEHSMSTLRQGPNVRYATRSKPVYPTMGESVKLIGADDAWNEFDDPDMAGEGVKIAILDTGIEHDHGSGFFSGDEMAFPDGDWPKGNGEDWDFAEEDFTNEKVIAAYAHWDEDEEDIDPGDEGGHGTHVAGTAAGRANTETDLNEKVNGVAPGAWLGNYNVFAGGSPTATENVIAAVEQATEDEFDVINMSLGGSISEPEDPLMEASESAIEDGVVVVSSAGNDGPGSETITSPAAAPNVTAVGASSNDWGIFQTLHVYEDERSDGIGPVAYLPGVDGGEIEEEILEKKIVLWADVETGSTTDLACDGRGRTGDLPELDGEVVLVQRGDCPFSEKANNIDEAGGSAMIVYNLDDADPEELITMTLTDDAALPSAFVTNVDGCRMVEFIQDNERTVDITLEEAAFPEFTPNILAEFSSRGPGPELEIKPEITGPGVDIYSSVTENGWATFSGTSMSSPHVAGAAALVQAQDPDWFEFDQASRGATDVLRMRSALVNNADLAVQVRQVTEPMDECEVETDKVDLGPMARGNGLLRVDRSIDLELLADPATVSFDQLASRGPPRRTEKERELSIENVSGSAVTLDVKVEGQSEPGPQVTVSPDEIGNLDDGDDAILTLTADGSTQPDGTYWGQVVLKDNGDIVVTVPFWYRVGR